MIHKFTNSCLYIIININDVEYGRRGKLIYGVVTVINIIIIDTIMKTMCMYSDFIYILVKQYNVLYLMYLNRSG